MTNSVLSNAGASATVSSPVKNEISLMDVLVVLARRKKAILTIPLLAGALAAGITMILPEVYKGTTKLLPPQQSQSGASAMLAQLGGAASLAGLGGIKTQNDVYVAILRSRTVADRLIDRFNLMKVYDLDSREYTRVHLETVTTIATGKDGLITIEVEDHSKKLAPVLTNAYVDELTKLSKTLAVGEAAQRRVFYENQLEQAKDNLAKAEIALKKGLDSNGVISADTESRALLETAARLKAQVSAKEIQLASMQAFVTPSHPEYRRAAEELSSLRGELARLEGGTSKDGNVASGMTASPQGGFESIQLLRDLKYRQMLYELLAKQYEVARIEEAKEPSMVQVLDPAIEPEKRIRPKRSIIVLLSAFSAALLTIAWALVSDVARKALLVPSTALRWAEFKKEFRRS